MTELSTPEVAALVDGYRAGATVYELATRFAIHRVTAASTDHNTLSHRPVNEPAGTAGRTRRGRSGRA